MAPGTTTGHPHSHVIPRGTGKLGGRKSVSNPVKYAWYGGFKEVTWDARSVDSQSLLVTAPFQHQRNVGWRENKVATSPAPASQQSPGTKRGRPSTVQQPCISTINSNTTCVTTSTHILGCYGACEAASAASDH
jgi:hypothetical protein